AGTPTDRKLIEVPPREIVNPEAQAAKVRAAAAEGAAASSAGSEPIGKQSSALIVEQQGPNGEKTVIDTTVETFCIVYPNDFIVLLAAYACEKEAQDLDQSFFRN